MPHCKSVCPAYRLDVTCTCMSLSHHLRQSILDVFTQQSLERKWVSKTFCLYIQKPLHCWRTLWCLCSTVYVCICYLCNVACLVNKGLELPVCDLMLFNIKRFEPHSPLRPLPILGYPWIICSHQEPATLQQHHLNQRGKLYGDWQFISIYMI